METNYVILLDYSSGEIIKIRLRKYRNQKVMKILKYFLAQ